MTAKSTPYLSCHRDNFSAKEPEQVAGLLVICGFILIFGIGFFSILRRLIAYRDDHDFAMEYRNKFVSFANTFLSTYDRFSKNGTINNEMYVWLTKSVTRIQNDLGHLGVMDYIGPFQQ